MKEKLNEYLQEGEQLLWCGAPTVKMLDDTHKNVYALKAILSIFSAFAFLMYYLLETQAGAIQFKPMVIVLLLVLVGVILAPDWMDVSKLNKAVYGVTDRRLLMLINGALHSIEFAKIDAYKFDTDEAGQTTLMCGKSGMKTRPSRRRVNTIFGTRMSDDGAACDRFVMYGLPESDQVAALLKKYIK